MSTDSMPAPGSSGAAAYDPAREYDVTLLRVVEWPKGTGIMHKPGDHHLMVGSVCQEIADVIADARPV